METPKKMKFIEVKVERPEYPFFEGFIHCTDNIYYCYKKEDTGISLCINKYVKGLDMEEIARYSPVPTLSTFKDSKPSRLHDVLERILVNETDDKTQTTKVVKGNFMYIINERLSSKSKKNIILMTYRGPFNVTKVSAGMDDIEFKFDPVPGMIIKKYSKYNDKCQEGCNGCTVEIHRTFNRVIVTNTFDLPCGNYIIDVVMRMVINTKTGEATRFDLVEA